MGPLDPFSHSRGAKVLSRAWPRAPQARSPARLRSLNAKGFFNIVTSKHMPEKRQFQPSVLAALDAALDLPRFFADYDPKTLSTFLPSLVIWSYAPSELVLEEGAESNYFYVLLQGSVSVQKTGGDEVACLPPVGGG